MAVYKCSICGAVYDEEKSGKPITELTECPVCKQPVSRFVLVEEEKSRKSPEPFMANWIMIRLSSGMIRRIGIWQRFMKWRLPESRSELQ